MVEVCTSRCFRVEEQVVFGCAGLEEPGGWWRCACPGIGLEEPGGLRMVEV